MLKVEDGNAFIIFFP